MKKKKDILSGNLVITYQGYQRRSRKIISDEFVYKFLIFNKKEKQNYELIATFKELLRLDKEIRKKFQKQ